jgi:hypothetical protein
VIYGVLMIVVMIYYPAGFAGLYYAAKNRIRAVLSRDKAEPRGA